MPQRKENPMTLDPDLARCVVALALLAIACPSARAAAPAASERDDAREWVATHIAGAPKDVPFSFVYGAHSSRETLASWRAESATRRLDAKRTEHTVTWTAFTTGMQARLVAIEYDDVPAIEWVLHFRNTGATDSLIIEDVQALDAAFAGAPMETFALHYALGESNSADSFRPVTDSIGPGDRQRIAPRGGRSSDGNMPYFNLQRRDGGIAIAVGWSGQWAADFQYEGNDAIRARAGMELMRLKLRPGEEIRTPRMLLVFWRGGDASRGSRLLRQTLLAHYTPRRKGEIVYPPICGTVGEVAPDGSYEPAHINVMKPLAERGIEVFWSDMDPQQWYPGGFPEGTGTWEPDPVKYPRGLKPVGDAARAAGLGYLLWFEPERVAKGTQIAKDHPEWVSGGASGGLFRLDIPEARKWITDKIDVQITLAGLSWVRWDFNIEPLKHWRRNDTPDREGMTEIRHIEGLYAMWDELERRHPGLLIDICASGGRRLDIELLSRGLPLWHSDMQCEGPHPEADQLQTAGLYHWLPLHGSGLFGLEPSYIFRSEMTAGNIFCLGAHTPENADAVKRSVALQKKLRPYTLGDFYELLPHAAETDKWFAYQFHRDDLDAGYVVAFRRPLCADGSKTLAPRGIEPGARYDVTFEDTGEHSTMTGAELASLKVTASTAPGSAIVTYRRAGALNGRAR
jgi:alpha-galactosidase